MQVIERREEFGGVELCALLVELALVLQVVEQLAAVDVSEHQIQLHVRNRCRSVVVSVQIDARGVRGGGRLTFSGDWNENLSGTLHPNPHPSKRAATTHNPTSREQER